MAVVGVVMLAVVDAPWRLVAMSMAGIAVAVHAPLLAVLFVVLAAVHALRHRLRLAAARDHRKKADLGALCDLTAIALTGGLGLQPALAIAACHVGGDVEEEIEGLLRRGRIVGIATAMAAAEGAGSRLYRIIGRAARSGSPLREPIARLADDIESELETDELARVRRLPITMLFPLTMLILPGFMLLAIAPSILDAFDRLQLAP